MSKNQEKEFKWDASKRGSFARFTSALKQLAEVSPAKQLAITDTYLDNAKQTFSKQKIALRVRCVGKHFEATLKTRNRLQNGLACRRELTKPLSQALSFQQALTALEKEKVWQGISLSDLQVRFSIKNKRTVYEVKHKNCRCEAALDNYVTRACGHQLRRKEIELELKQGRSRDFENLITQLSNLSGLSAAEISKVAGAEKWIKQKFRIN